MVVAGVIADESYRKVQIAGAVIAFAGLLLSLFGRGLIMWAFGLKHVHLRKPMLTYWKLFNFFWFMAEMVVLFTLGETERVSGSGVFFNWSRWPFYTVSIGIGFVGMVSIFQQHSTYWTRWYISGYVLLMGLFATWNAFAPFHAQRMMMIGFQALGLFGYFVSLFWFDERKDCTSRSVSFCATACIAVITAGFLVGHAGSKHQSRANEAIFYIVSMAFMGLVLPIAKLVYCVFPTDVRRDVECQAMCAPVSQQQQ